MQQLSSLLQLPVAQSREPVPIDLTAEQFSLHAVVTWLLLLHKSRSVDGSGVVEPKCVSGLAVRPVNMVGPVDVIAMNMTTAISIRDVKPAVHFCGGALHSGADQR